MQQQPVIFHIDVNSAFLSWEADDRIRKGETIDIRTIPAVIGGSQKDRHGIVLAKSVSAKKFGIRTGEPLTDARRKCPGLQIIPPNFPVYVRASALFMEKLRSYAPLVEQFSIDEAFCDMTGTGRLYGDPVAFAHRLKDEIHQELGFTVNIGVSTNKLLAKMASDFEKPDRVHTLFPEEIPAKMWPLDIEELFFVGKRTAATLRSIGIRTIGELAATSPDILRSRLKSHGITIWNYANGRDSEHILDHTEPAKGYGNSLTLSYDVTDVKTARYVLLSLCETVGTRIRADHVYIQRVSVSIRDSDFHTTSRQETLFSATDVTEVIYETACRLFDQLWDYHPIRLLGVQTFQVKSEEYQQYSLFGDEKYEQLKKVNHAVDEIRKKFGEDAIKRACFLDEKRPVDHMTGRLSKAKRTNH